MESDAPLQRDGALELLYSELDHKRKREVCNHKKDQVSHVPVLERK
jgi:hypothetical protein